MFIELLESLGESVVISSDATLSLVGFQFLYRNVDSLCLQILDQGFHLVIWNFRSLDSCLVLLEQVRPLMVEILDFVDDLKEWEMRVLGFSEAFAAVELLWLISLTWWLLALVEYLLSSTGAHYSSILLLPELMLLDCSQAFDSTHLYILIIIKYNIWVVYIAQIKRICNISSDSDSI